MEEGTAKIIVKIYSVFSWIAGIAYVLMGLALMLLNKGISFGFNGFNISQTLFIVIGIFLVALGAFVILLAINLWKFKNWARITNVVIICIGLLFLVLSLITGINASTIVSIIINGVFLYFLAFNKTVIALFK
ncbi:MAG: hypothetical protein WCF78_02530 [archaeon]